MLSRVERVEWYVGLLGELASLRDGAREEAREVRLERARVAVRLGVLSACQQKKSMTGA